MCSIFVLKSIYDYNDPKDPKILTFDVNERFILIKDPDGTDWFYVINTFGKIGYVPNSYVQFEENLNPTEILKLIDLIAANLDLKNVDKNKLLTDRQLKHAQIKLAQLRCEVTQSFVKDQCAVKAPSELTAIVEGENDESSNKVCSSCNQLFMGDNDIGEHLISSLIESVKLDASLSERKAITVTNSVMKTLAENIPAWSNNCKQILDILDKYVQEKVNSENVYSSKLKCIFKRLWYCKNDTQQRNWPVYQDEDIISGYLDELVNLLHNTEQVYLENEICFQNYENIHLLIAYFQMETRRLLRMKLMEIFISFIKLFHNINPEFFLSTVLPSELAIEMQNYLSDTERWIRASNLFTLIFSSGHKPPIAIYEHLNEQFFSHQIDLIEGFDINGKAIECSIPAEYIISPILSFNLHISDATDNVIFKALRKRTNASHLMENLISYFNWEEDIILTSCSYVRLQEDEPVPNSVLKFLNEMFSDKVVAILFYYNDVRVIIDIIISQLNNLPVGDIRIKSYLELLVNILNNTQYTEEPHKASELKKCLTSIQHHEFSNAGDVQMAQDIVEQFTETFNYANQL